MTRLKIEGTRALVEVFRLLLVVVVVRHWAQGGRFRGCHRGRIKATGRWMTYLRKAQSESWNRASQRIGASRLDR